MLLRRPFDLSDGTMKIKNLIVFCLVFLAVVFAVYCGFQMRARQARFNVFALGTYLHAHGLVGGKPITTLSALPDADLICHGEGLEFRAADMRGRIAEGYFYDFSRKDSGAFVISASPLHMTGLQAEFGMLEDMNLRMNKQDVDPGPDSRDEVLQWPILPVWYELQTRRESS